MAPKPAPLARTCDLRRAIVVIALSAAILSPGAAFAQQAVPAHPPRLTHARLPARAPARVVVSARRGSLHDLTINRRPRGDGIEPGSDDGTFVDGPIRYNSVRRFDPAPYADSGKEFPFGLDGIGGYGSDLGAGLGEDTLTYDRGP